MQIIDVDVEDDAALQEWYDAYLVADVYGQDFPTPWRWPEVVADVRAEPVHKEVRLLAGRDGDQVVAAGLLELPLRDNRDHCWLMAFVRPEWRRHGHGTAMLTALEDAARARGRQRAGSQADYAYELGAEGRGSAGVEFLLARGYTLALGDVKRVLDLPVAEELLADLVAEAAPYHRAYALRAFVGPCPDDLVDSYARLLGSLTTEAPVGTKQIEPEVYDEARVRHEEAVAVEAGRTSYVTVAVDRDGEAVAYSQLLVPRHEPGRAYQWGTLVHPAHRGRRLGLAVKAANHRLLQQHEPGLSVCLTWNAEVNDHMIGINERLGFRPVGRSAEFERSLA